MSTNESTKESTNDLIIESTNKSKNEINKKYYENKKNDFEFIKKKNERALQYHRDRQNNEEYKEYRRQQSKKYYELNKQKVLDRVNNYNKLKKIKEVLEQNVDNANLGQIMEYLVI